MDDVVLYEVSDGIAKITLNRPDQMNAWTESSAMSCRPASARLTAMTRLLLSSSPEQGKPSAPVLTLVMAKAVFFRSQLMTMAAPSLAVSSSQADHCGSQWSCSGRGHHIFDALRCQVGCRGRQDSICHGSAGRGARARITCHFAEGDRILKGSRVDVDRPDAVGSGGSGTRARLRAVPADQVLTEAMSLAADMVRDASPVALAVSKQLLWQGVTAGVDEMLSREGRGLVRSLACPTRSKESPRFLNAEMRCGRECQRVG